LANAGYASKGKRPSREEMAKVKATEPRGFSEKLTEKIIMPVEDDVWTVKAVAPAASAAEAVALVQDVLGGTTIDKDIPRCRNCHDHKPMDWKTGVSAKGKAWGKFDCYVCRDVIWYNISKDGTWKPQEVRA
jgi:hypothetical protein